MANEKKTRELPRPDRERIGIMVDIETMGCRASAPILEIGACAFDLDRGIFDHFQADIALASAMEAGAKPDAATILWWLGREERARAALTAATPREPIGEAVRGLAAFVRRHEGATVWCKGASFDFPIVKFAFGGQKLPCPWPHWDERCLRTLLGERPELHALRFEGVPHRALDDARHQARQVLEAWLTGGAR